MLTATRKTEEFKAFTEQRCEARFPIALPATAVIGDTGHSVRVLNVAPGGAMLEISKCLAAGSRLLFRCGTISVTATVAWQAGGRTGVSFDFNLDAKDVQEQRSRSFAVASRRELRRRSLLQAVTPSFSRS